MNDLKKELKSRFVLNPFKKMNIKIDLKKMMKKKDKKGKESNATAVQEKPK